MFKKALIIAICISLFLWVFFLQQKPVAAPAVFLPPALKRLTIASLRDTNYESTFGTREFAYQTDTYTAYITSYQSEDNRIYGLLTVPTGSTPANGWPAIVFVHGYIPPNQYETNGQAYSAYVDYLARNGFVVFKPDLRGHGKSQGTPGGAYFSSDYVIDVLNSRSAVQKLPEVNPKKVGLWGHSMGGNIVLRSLAVRPEIPAAVVWAGAGYSYADLQKYGIQDTSYVPRPTQNQERQKLRSSVLTTSFLPLIAPTYYLGDLQGAIQLHHAIDDDVVSVAYSRDLIKLLDKTKVPHELVEYPSGGHNIKGENFVPAMERTVAFFKKYLQ